MHLFISMLSFLSALVLIIILFASDYNKSDKTWKSFSAMVLFYIGYDLILFFGNLSSNQLLASFARFTAVCCAVLAVFEFHFYLICFFREKKMVEIPDTTKFVGGFGIVFLIIWTIYNVFFETRNGGISISIILCFIIPTASIIRFSSCGVNEPSNIT